MDDESGTRRVRGQRDEALERQIGARVRALREQAGLSREALAEHIGLTPLQLGKLETAANIVNVSHLARIARALGFRVGDFYPDPDPSAHMAAESDASSLAGANGRTIKDPMEHPESKALIEAYQAIPTDLKTGVLALLQSATALRR